MEAVKLESAHVVCHLLLNVAITENSSGSGGWCSHFWRVPAKRRRRYRSAGALHIGFLCGIAARAMWGRLPVKTKDWRL